MNTSNQPERFHALDATRAFALLLGVVFHAAWSYVPAPMGAPIVDASASRFFDWFFFTSHTFRMQLFFLIAGFFAHLVCHRRGFTAFARNRLMRIGVPLVVGWLILYPLVVGAFVAGGNVSGRNLTEIPLTAIFGLLYQKGAMFIPRSLGGMFGLAHLWFLYYLLWLYALVLGLRFLLTRSETVADRLRGWADGGVNRVMRSPVSIVLLAVGMGVFLWPMHGWFGVDTPLTSAVPSIPVLVFYGSFFVFGWFIHRQAHLLTNLVRHWRWQLALGLVLSIPLFGVFKGLRESEAGISMSGQYPKLQVGQITDWPMFLTRLQSASNPATAPAQLVNAWTHLKPGAQQRILKMTAEATLDQRAGVANTLGKLLAKPHLFQTNTIPPGSAPAPAEAQRVLLENRAKLERLFAGSLAGDPLKLGWYRPVKLAYSVGYGLVMWLLLFGTLGFFQARCSGHSPAWRYVADSSYWVYLAHLPLVAVLQIWMASWAWPGLIKFLFLNAVAFAILFASYHYCVRSTFIGRILNGRSHPLVAWPFIGSEKRTETASISSTHPVARMANPEKSVN